jgi:hypothetical protein
VQLAMSALGHKRTFRHSLDHLVGAGEQRFGTHSSAVSKLRHK